jgi:hypothetical protein
MKVFKSWGTGKMKFTTAACLSLLALGYANSANAATIVVDGILDAAYGAPTAVIPYDAAAPSGNFGNPSAGSNAIGYSIYLTNQGGTVYAFLSATGPGTAVASFANVYFGINAGGSTLGFEVTNQDAFTPGVSGSNILVSFPFATTASTVEFAIPESFFEGPLGTLPSAGGHPGDKLVLRLSQSFGYSVAGGGTFGPDRLGAVTLSSAVPELSTWGMMLIGFAGIGFMAYRRSRKAFAAA